MKPDGTTGDRRFDLLIIKLEQFFVSSYGGKYVGIVQLSVRFFVTTSPKGQKLIAYPKRVPKGAFLLERFVANPPSRYPKKLNAEQNSVTDRRCGIETSPRASDRNLFLFVRYNGRLLCKCNIHSL